MMSKKVLKYDEKFTPAVAQVFRKSMLVRDLKVGARVARENELDCITLDGDQVRAGSPSIHADPFMQPLPRQPTARPHHCRPSAPRVRWDARAR